MPKYEYQCIECKKLFDIKRTVDEEIRKPVTHCPYCGKYAKRVFGVPYVRGGTVVKDQ